MNGSSIFASVAVFAAGAAHIDRRGRCFDPFQPGASNPGRMRESVGGATFNAIRAVRALGGTACLVGARGGDEAGTVVQNALSALGVRDLAMTWLDRRTPTYTALLDDRGDLVGGLADMELYDLLRPRVFERRHIRDAVADCDVVLLDANLPSATISRMVDRTGDKPVFAIGVSTAKVGRLAPVIQRLEAIFLSRAEAAWLLELPDATPVAVVAGRMIEAGCRRAAITGGAGPVAIVENGTTRWQPPSAVSAVRDVTGAGDTLAGVAMAAFASGRPFAEAVRLGMAAASLHVSFGRDDGDFTADEIRAWADAMPPGLDHSSE